jgi:hypothetical protein
MTAARKWRPATLLSLAFVGLVPCLLCGCGHSVPLGEVDGIVRLDGQPIGKVMVVFIPEDPHLPQSFGISDEQGRFQLRCNNRGMGAAVGEHRVTLVDAAVAPAPKSTSDDELPQDGDVPPSRVPPVYTRADKTPLRQTVAPGSQSVTIECVSQQKVSGS